MKRRGLINLKYACTVISKRIFNDSTFLFTTTISHNKLNDLEFLISLRIKNKQRIIEIMTKTVLKMEDKIAQNKIRLNFQNSH